MWYNNGLSMGVLKQGSWCTYNNLSANTRASCKRYQTRAEQRKVYQRDNNPKNYLKEKLKKECLKVFRFNMDLATKNIIGKLN